MSEIDTGNLIADPLYLAFDALYQRGWADLERGQRNDPRGSKEWQFALDVVRQALPSSEGDVTVPEDPSPEMVRAGLLFGLTPNQACIVYQSMLAKRPK